MNKSLWSLLPIYIVVAVDSLGTGMLSPILAQKIQLSPEFFNIASWHSAYAEHIIFGLILGLFPLCFMLGAPIVGFLSDKFGRKPILLGCLIASSLGFFLYYWAFIYDQLIVLLLARIVSGFAAASQSIGQAIVVDSSQTSLERTQRISYVAVAMTIGLVVGPFLGGLLSDHHVSHLFSNRLPFIVALALSVINLFMLLICYKADQQFIKSKRKLSINVSQLINAPSLLFLLAIFFAFELAWSLYFQSLAVYLVQVFATPKAEVGIHLSLVGLILSLFLPFAAKLLLRRFSQQFTLALGMLCMLLSLLLLGLWQNYMIFYLASMGVVLATAILYPVLITNIVQYFADRGFILGVSDAVLALAFAITGVLTGWLNYYAPSLAFFVAAGFIAISFMMLLRHKSMTTM